VILPTNDRLFPGVGLRPTHYPFLEDESSQIRVKWFEAISENYMDSEGRPFQMLSKIRRDFPVALHGVSMNLASTDGLNPHYLKRLKLLVDRISPMIVSDHLCWTGINPSNIHDLLPFPLTKESLDVVLKNVDQAQTALQRQILIENPSTYMSFKQSEYSEWDFLLEIVRRSGARLLLDINNIYVSAKNVGIDPWRYLQAIPSDLVGQVHLAGHSNQGEFLFDTHSTHVHSEVWKMFAQFMQQNQEIPFMVEWDEDIPEFKIVEDEVFKGVEIIQQATEIKQEVADGTGALLTTELSS
jgi:uncharacterized protein